MMDFKPLITLLAIVNPLAIVPFFIHYTEGFDRQQRQRTVWVAAFSAFVVIATSALMGLAAKACVRCAWRFTMAVACGDCLALLRGRSHRRNSLPLRCASLPLRQRR
jgi:hypothetical protein